MCVLNLRTLLGSAAVAVLMISFFVLGQHVFTTQFPLAVQVSGRWVEAELPLFRVLTEEKLVVLTFDVSWGDTVAAEVAARLSELGTCGTFFVTGPWARTHPRVVHWLLQRGHDVASLGGAAVDYRKLSSFEIRRDMLGARQVLERFDGALDTVFRPPGGEFDVEVLAAARSLGCRLVLWDVESWDWKLETPDAIVDRVLGIIRPGSLVHFHADDSYPVVPGLISNLVNELRRAGYTVQPLSAVLEPTPATGSP